MKQKQLFRQCQLQKGTRFQTSWIPTQFAHAGKILELKKGDEWENGWVVNSASTIAIEEPPRPEELIRAHRRATGDSMKKERN